MIIMIIVVVLAGAVIRWVRAGEREIRFSKERRIPRWLFVIGGFASGCGEGSTWLGRRSGLGGCVAVLGWVYGPRRTISKASQNNLHGKYPGLCHPVVRVRGAGCCGIVWRHGLRADYPKAPPGGGASAAPRGQRYEPGGCRRGARLVDQQGKSH